ncbi:MAG: helix-turn-helix transcriptional regulator [Clostridia bacterium]|nr:helix-turn-helix transcriptional regulator [Clostridia bacterium]
MKIDTKLNEENADLLKALAHPARLCIVKNMIEKGGCTVSYMHTCMGQPQSTLSQHIARLKSQKIISGTRRGKEITYEVSSELAKGIIKILYK